PSAGWPSSWACALRAWPSWCSPSCSREPEVGPRDGGVVSARPGPGARDRSEGGLVVAGRVAPATTRLATLATGGLTAEAGLRLTAALLATGRPRVGLLATEAGTAALRGASAAPAAALAAATAALGLRHLGGGVAQRRADLVDLHLHDGALLPGLLVLPRAGDEAAGDDDARATDQRLGGVLRGLAPHGAAHEERL